MSSNGLLIDDKKVEATIYESYIVLTIKKLFVSYISKTFLQNLRVAKASAGATYFKGGA